MNEDIPPWQFEAPTNERLDVFKGNVFLIRDLPKSEWEGDLHCEYATLDADLEWLVWHPCIEGVMFGDIQPLASLADLAKMDISINSKAGEQRERQE